MKALGILNHVMENDNFKAHESEMGDLNIIKLKYYLSMSSMLFIAGLYDQARVRVEEGLKVS